MEIRLLGDDDSIAELTDLLHRAYKRLGDMGLRFFATHQTEEQTLSRVRAGTCFVGMCDGRIVATISVYRGRRNRTDGGTDGPDWYRRDGVYYFGQFAVDPNYQGRGFGNMLLMHVESLARNEGC